jgi:hypothetical protein
MAKRSREADARPLRRRTGTRRPKKTLVVFCEGEKTEPQYLEALKRQPEIRDAAAVDLRIETGHGGAVPLTLVSLAIDARSRAVAEEAEIDELRLPSTCHWWRPRRAARLTWRRVTRRTVPSFLTTTRRRGCTA